MRGKSSTCRPILHFLDRVCDPKSRSETAQFF